MLPVCKGVDVDQIGLGARLYAVHLWRGETVCACTYVDGPSGGSKGRVRGAQGVARQPHPPCM